MTDVLDRLKTALADRYAIEREIGSGGMATVYLAEDLKHHRKVAVKVLLPELAAVLGAERFLREIEIAAGLTHPHILPLHDSGQANGFLYYVMPYVEGESLRTRLEREHQLPIDETVRITEQVAAALQYAHGEEIIHRDIKPENVLLHRGEVMVADFGIALAVREAGGARLTETGLSIGTPQYMSPEQASGDRRLDGRSDIYSLGCVCYEMLVGEAPYTGPTLQAIIAKVLTEPPPSIRNARDTVSPALEQVVLHSVAKLAADRFATAQEFADALSSSSRTAGTAAGPPVVKAATTGWQLSRTAVIGWILASLMTVAALWGWMRSDAPQPVARYRIGFPEDQTMTGRFAVSPDGSAWAYVGRGEHGNQLWIKRRPDERATQLLGTEGAASPFFSPDGEWVGFFAEGEIRKIPVGGGTAATVADSARTTANGAAWLDDGSVVFLDLAFDLVRVPATGGERDHVVVFGDIPELPFPTLLSPLPDARGVLVTTCSDVCAQSAVWVLDLHQGNVRPLVEGGFGAWYIPTGHVLYGDQSGALFAAPFDVGSLELTGPALPVSESVAGSPPLLALSRSGDLLYVKGVGEIEGRQLVWVKRDGTARPIDPEWTGIFRTVALSPDGTRLAVSITGDAGQDLWVKQLERGPASRLTFTDGLDRRPTWMPDGQSVMFQSERGDNRDLYMTHADGRGSAELVLDLAGHVDQGLWSASGDWLIYRTGITGGEGRDIFAWRSGPDSATVPVATAPGIDEHSPALSPDGKWLAYVSNETGRWEVYVRPFPNVETARWQVSVQGGTEPVWAHSGRELFFRSDLAQMVADAVTTPTFSPGPPRALFSLQGYATQPVHALYDVSADDQRFVMIRLASHTQGRGLILVENFFEELKAKVGN